MILITYTISLRVNKETKKSIKVGAAKVYDTNHIYSRVNSLRSGDRLVDIADLLARACSCSLLQYSQIVEN